MKRSRRLRRLYPDAELYRRRAAGETLRALAPNYGVAHTTLSRHFARPQAAKQLREAERLLRAERRAVADRLRAAQKAEREARDGRLPLPRADLYSRGEQEAALAVAAGGGMQAVIEATGLRTLKNVLGLTDPAILEQALKNDAARAAAARLRRLKPDPELYRRRAAGETLRALAPDYGVAHTTLSRHFARPQAAKQLKEAEQRLRAEQKAATARLRAAQEAKREARRLATRQRLASDPAPVRRRQAPRFATAEERFAYYDSLRLRSEIDWLNSNDVRAGRLTPAERRLRERD